MERDVYFLFGWLFVAQAMFIMGHLFETTGNQFFAFIFWMVSFAVAVIGMTAAFVVYFSKSKD